MSVRPSLLYILAPSYSGSTLLTYLLARHPRISTIGELKATEMGDVDRYACSCGRLIVECPFWAELTRACAERGLRFDVHEFGTALGSPTALGNKLIRMEVRGPLFETLRRAALGIAVPTHRLLARQIRRNFDLSRVIAELQGGDIFLDGSKDATRLKHFIDAGLWDVRVIYLQRDGRGVSASIAKHLGVPFERAAEEWATNARGLEHMRRRLPESIVSDLRYEDLCREPAATLERLFAWLGIDPAPVETSNFKDGDFHILGNSMRLNSMAEIRLDERWRSSLEDEHKRYFSRRFGQIHRQLGYS